MGKLLIEIMFFVQAVIGAYLISYHLIPWLGGRRHE